MVSVYTPSPLPPNGQCPYGNNTIQKGTALRETMMLGVNLVSRVGIRTGWGLRLGTLRITTALLSSLLTSMMVGMVITIMSSHPILQLHDICA